MAKSKSGGTRSYLRGKIGADVYSIGKDGKGAKQQVVRSLAEVVSNPQTEAQMRGRMIMSTVMQAVASMSQIIDHSFDGLPAGQPSISEFIRQNYALIKADVAAHPSTGNAFGLNKYQEKGIKAGAYVVAQGKAILPSEISFGENSEVIINLGASNMTVGALKSLFNGGDDYITAVGVTGPNGFVFIRIKVATTLSDETAITSENAMGIFSFEGNDTVLDAAVADGNITLTLNEASGYLVKAMIISVKENGAWIHNNATLSTPANAQFTADVALPTYPTGAARFLNGGEL